MTDVSQTTSSSSTSVQHRPPAKFAEERRTLGQRAADKSSALAGSWKFINAYMVFTVLWCVGNAAVLTFDPYPYQFYTFSVSVLAILLGSLILLAGNRQSEVDRAHAENAYNHVNEVNSKQDDQLRILREQNAISSAQHVQILKKIATILSFRGSRTFERLNQLLDEHQFAIDEAEAQALAFADAEAQYEARLGQHRTPQELHDAPRTFGQRAADACSSATGSWCFIGIYLALTAIWCLGNITVVHFDPYPYAFYTFSVSVLAILMSSLILLAGNRQSDIDRAHAENAYHHVDEVNAKQDEQLLMLAEQNALSIAQHERLIASLSAIVDGLNDDHSH